MRVTRITLDADLGLIELKTGPGGDGNYVLLPIDVPPTAERYLQLPGEPCEAEAPEKKETLVEEFLRTPGKFFGPNLSLGTITNPINVIAVEHTRGYRLTCPVLPHWKLDINEYDLYKVPRVVKERINEIGGMNTEDLTVSIVIKEMD